MAGSGYRRGNSGRVRQSLVLGSDRQSHRTAARHQGLRVDSGYSRRDCRVVIRIQFVGFEQRWQHVAIARARKIERFLSQPFHVAEVFTGSPGVFVELADTIHGFKGLCEGKYDYLPEAAFYMVGTIEQAVEKGKKLAAEAA